MNHEQAQSIANERNLGKVYFQYNVSQNTGKQFEVGYVFLKGERILFCKRQSHSSTDEFYLCNEFRE